MKFIGNIIWIVFGGFVVALEYLIAGLILCVTIVGIPFGLQAFKLGMLALWPFGAEIQSKENASGCLSTGMNIIWIIFGLFIALTHLIFGLIFFITIIGIPFGMQHMKLAALALAPFGKTYVYK